MTPEEWEALYKLTGEALHRAIHEGFWRPVYEAGKADSESLRWSEWTKPGAEFSAKFTSADWSGARSEEGHGEYIPGKNLDIVKIAYESPFEHRQPFLERLHNRRCYADMWRGTEHVCQPLMIGKMEEFVTALKDDGFTESRGITNCIHYLWRKRS